MNSTQRYVLALIIEAHDRGEAVLETWFDDKRDALDALLLAEWIDAYPYHIHHTEYRPTDSGRLALVEFTDET